VKKHNEIKIIKITIDLWTTTANNGKVGFKTGARNFLQNLIDFLNNSNPNGKS